MAPKQRLDQVLVSRGLCESRTQAQGLILAGQVRLNDAMVDKPGLQLEDDPKNRLALTGVMPYVSRGGLKLEKALAEFNLDPAGLTCLDVGASTGGFTDCLLQNGANRVIAVDVGYGQIDWRLRQDPRVTVIEKTNARYLTRESMLALLGEAVYPELGLIVMDVSFISILKVLGPLRQLVEPDTRCLALLKPQFEYQEAIGNIPGKPRFDGVVRDSKDRQIIIDWVIKQIPTTGWNVQNLVPSPIQGPKGNIEFLLDLNASPFSRELQFKN